MKLAQSWSDHWMWNIIITAHSFLQAETDPSHASHFCLHASGCWYLWQDESCMDTEGYFRLPCEKYTVISQCSAHSLFCGPGVMHYGPVGKRSNWHHPLPRAARNNVGQECPNLILVALTWSGLSVQ